MRTTLKKVLVPLLVVCMLLSAVACSTAPAFRSGGCTFRCSAARASRSFRGGSNQNRGWTYDHQVWLLSCEL